MSDDTLLVISAVGVPDWSARGLREVLEQIGESAQFARTVNGALLDLSYDAFRKYRLRVSCEDMRVPAIDGVFPGTTALIETVSELCYPVAGSPSRDVVTGSERTEGNFVFYRPILDMMLVSPVRIETDEWGARVGWDMVWEER